MPTKSQIKIVCLEDEASLRENLSDIIRGEGYAVYAFGDGAEALSFLEKAAGNVPHLVIADINMPQMNGLEFVRRMKTIDQKHDQIPIIMLTAMTQDQFRSKASTLSVQEYLIKPVDYDVLLQKVEEYTRNAYS